MSGIHSFILTVFVLSYTVVSIQADEVCDKSQCRGPIRYYEELKCKPIYKTPESCCPYKYDCDHLKARLPNKCYFNGHEYNVKEVLRKEDEQPCIEGCVCEEFGDKARFMCAMVQCSNAKPGCYLRPEVTRCCPQIVCPKDNEKQPTCLVDGRVYEDGKQFTPVSEPDKICYCGPGYTNETADSFCKPKHPPCAQGLHRPYDNKCVPIYYSSQSPQSDCHYFTRCHNERDMVIKKSRIDDNPNETDNMVCKFGDLTMRYGDELIPATDYGSVCMNCTCEVGPIPTCQRLPKIICDPTQHSFTSL